MSGPTGRPCRFALRGISMGGRIVGSGLADEIVKVWLDTPFAGGRHQRRIEQIAALEKPMRNA